MAYSETITTNPQPALDRRELNMENLQPELQIALVRAANIIINEYNRAHDTNSCPSSINSFIRTAAETVLSAPNIGQQILQHTDPHLQDIEVLVKAYGLSVHTISGLLEKDPIEIQSILDKSRPSSLCPIVNNNEQQLDLNIAPNTEPNPPLQRRSFELTELGTPLLNTREVASLFSVTPQSVRNWVNTGKIKCLRLPSGRQLRFERQYIAKLLENRSELDSLE